MTQKKPKRERFPKESLENALERSIRNAKHLHAKDAATVAAARSLAWRIDHWEKLAELAMEEAQDEGTRPKLPQNDNTSLPTFLKYCDALGLTPDINVAAGQTSTKPAKTTVQVKPSNKILQFRTAT